METTRRRWCKGSGMIVLAGAVILTLAVSAPVRPQEPAQPVESLVEAARNARAHTSNGAAHAKIFTNDDFAVQPPPSSTPATNAEPPSQNPPEEPVQQPTGCHNPEEDDRLKQDLEASQEELDQVRRELSYDPKVISNGDVDLTNFKSGASGLAFGSPPLSQAQPQSPARVSEVMLEEKVSALKQASRVACDPPEEAGTQRQIDAAKQQLKLLQSEFVLDRAAYYSKPNYADDPMGQAKLDAEQQQIQALQSEIERLKDELRASKSNPEAAEQ